MCTVVCRYQPGQPWSLQLLALRDEFAARAFDRPGHWWPEQPEVIAGRDRLAGGSWCVSEVATGVTAVVLNRPEPRAAQPGAPSRGVLPLLAARHGSRWTEHLDVTGMAGFNLVLLDPQRPHWWSFDGERLQDHSLPPGGHMFTPLGRAGELDPRWAVGAGATVEHPEAATATVWAAWLEILRERPPSPETGALLVRREIAGRRYETVFAQFIATRPGWARLDYLNTPGDGLDRAWTTRVLTSGSRTVEG